mmetsp:Transcript_77234/g.151268  ORF Transcript_77234/g.151268 Transcript_77234/m.151268 type:complete len:365 (-) Transcript_77234:192-1286(-)|eukprot:CAMPEP_0171961198 /NCGR_PEP_ID=MMETSP0993-20121228/160768_1 /TAXON_ID=483369 /ORGANISM="non described non described, Strain CCMP2098" /LENGTH=364 /DNA_ID=CAMNT_0012609191 /DNA_START=155 /DNA_END=1249 /DNA_ORIENTATION=-
MATATNSLSISADQFLRDEFTCPITMELLRDPVMAADGHTYDRAAIQKWLYSHGTSPKTGQEMANTDLIENHNLKRLINDLVEEGGAGLYTKLAAPASEGVSGPRRVLMKEKLLVLNCVESSSGQTGGIHYVGQRGAEGGRMRPTEAAASTNYIQLHDDPSCSRRHFKISYDNGEFSIYDLGSGTGTLVQIPHSNGHALAKGDIFCMGKHQFLVEDMNEPEESPNCPPDSKPGSELNWRLRLRCVSPVGSPLENKAFSVGHDGATLGRGSESTIPFTVNAGDKYRVVDTAVSTQHARIVPFTSEGRRRFVLLDGSEERPSSNGTWIRLSPIHKPSSAWLLIDGIDFVVGSNRFTVSSSSTIIEI